MLNKIIITFLAVLIIGMLLILYILKDIVAPMMNIWFAIIMGSIILVVGFLTGVKFMSEF